MLLGYRSRPHTVTGVPPAELLLKRGLKTTLSLVHPDIGETVDNKTQGQKYYHDRTAVLRARGPSLHSDHPCTLRERPPEPQSFSSNTTRDTRDEQWSRVL